MATSKSKKRRGGRNRGAQLTESEWAIMRVVWQSEPCAAGTVQEALQKTKRWAYSTVKTTMDRMVKKGLLATKSIRNLQLFSSRISETDAKRGELRKMLKRAFDGALTPMMQFLLENEPISEETLKELRALVNKRSRDRGAKS